VDGPVNPLRLFRDTLHQARRRAAQHAASSVDRDAAEI